MLLDNGSHSVDLIRFLAGDVAEVSAVFSDEVDAINELRHLDITLRTVSNGIGTIELDGRSSGSSGMNIVEIFGTKGMGCISYNDVIPSYWRSDDDGVHMIEMDEGLDGAHRFTREIAHFISCVKGEEENALPACEGTEDLKVIEAVYRAGTEKTVISLNA